MTHLEDRFILFKVWFVVGCVFLGIVVFLSLTSNPPKLPDFGLADKVGHLIAYATLMGWFGQLFTRITRQLLLCLFFILLGAILEFLQSMNPHRSYELADMLANSLGVLLGWWLTRAWFAGFLIKVEKQVLRIARL